MKGFLFIGDPHVASKRPGRRKDDYQASVLGKLAVAAEIARREDLLPVILGDLFHIASENHLPTLYRLITVLKQFHTVPICVGGNHDKKELSVTEVDALALLSLVGVLEVVDGDAREVRIIDTPAGRMSLWIAPYGSTLPKNINSNADQVILATHHDLAFEGCYPGATELFEIPGCDLVVNGHMHKTAPSVLKGQTHWHCPGNIEPLSIDCRDHVPAVWTWVGGNTTEALGRIVLPHERDCFDMTGSQVQKSSTTEAVKSIEVEPAIHEASHFAALLGATTTMEASRTEDDQTFIEDLDQGLRELEASEHVCVLLRALASKKQPSVIDVSGEVVAA